MKKYWTKTMLKTSWANSKLCISMSGVKSFFMSPTLSNFVENALLFHGFICLSLSSFPQKLSYDSDTNNILESPTQSRLYIQWPLWNFTYEYPVTHLASETFLSHNFRVPSFSVFYPLKTEPWC